MRLSFIIPVYRPDIPTLKKCCRALMEQSLSKDDFELIFVLDGPDEEAKAAIMGTLAKVKFRIETIDHGGACTARNHGAKHAKGDLWVFWDCDCVIEVCAAQGWVDVFDANPEVDFVYADYKFLDVDGVIPSEPFDPWLLKINNYISACYPLRKEVFPGWDESLKSLQDWDFWLSVVEKGGRGHRMEGHSFATLAPRAGSISGDGCTDENWLPRRDIVRKKHGIADKKVCVSAMAKKHVGVRLAKNIDADYRDLPTLKPHRYEHVIQIGWSFQVGHVNRHAAVFSDPEVKKILFWDRDSVHEAYTRTSRRALKEYSDRLNPRVRQFCEDREALRLLELCGFKATVLPLPMLAPKPKPVPEDKKILVDCGSEYGEVMLAIDAALPDVTLEVVHGTQKVSDYRGFVSLHKTPSMTDDMKKMLMAGKHVISNVQAFGTGYVSDEQPAEVYVPKMVDKIRRVVRDTPDAEIAKTYAKTLDPKKLMGVICAR